MDNSFTRVCAVVCIIFVQVSSAPTNSEQDVNSRIKKACAPHFDNKDPLPAGCGQRQDEPVNELCNLLVGYVLDLCHVKKFEGITQDSPSVCSIQLPNPNYIFSEKEALLHRLNNQTLCNSNCKSDMALCKRIFNLANLLSSNNSSKDESKINSTVIVTKNKLVETIIPSNAPQTNSSPGVVSKDTTQKSAANNPSVETAQGQSSSFNLHDSQNPVQVSKSNIDGKSKTDSSIDKKPNSQPISDDHAETLSLPVDNVKTPENINIVNEDRKVNVEPIQSEGPKDKEVDKVEVQLPDNIPVPDKPNDGYPQEDQLNDPVRTDDEDPDDHDGNFQPEDLPEEGENNDDLSIKEDEVKPPNQQPSQLKIEDSNIPISESNGPFQESPDSHFFSYFLFFTCITIAAYIAFHNKNKILALALEGRRGRNGRRRPNTASYRKLDANLEEAMANNPSRVNGPHLAF